MEGRGEFVSGGTNLLEVGGGGGWVPETPGKVNLVRAEQICNNGEAGSENEVILGNKERLVSEFSAGNVEELNLVEENGSSSCHHDPLASWNGFAFGDLLARANMGKTEPLLDFTSDSVRCSSSSFFVPGNGEVVAIDVDRWAGRRPEPQGESEQAAEGAGKQKPEEGQALDSSGNITILGEPSSPEQGEKQIPDLNATPQQKQKRRKHRPKVVIEGKPKRPGKQAAATSTPKSSETAEKRKYVRRKPTDDTDNPRVKRKYVRKNDLIDPLPKNPPAGAGKDGELKGSKRTKKSCRKVLNFDSDSKTNDAGLEPKATPGDKANPILLSDTDTDQEKELAKFSDCPVGVHHAKGETVAEENSVSCTADPTYRSRMNMSQAQHRSLHTYQELSKNGFKHTPASVNLADLVNHRREEHGSTTSSTSSTTNSRNDGKLPREWWHCGPNNPTASNPKFQDSNSEQNKKATDTIPAQDVSADISSLKDPSVNQTSLKSHTQGKLCVADIGSRDQARSARKNRIQKRKQVQNLLSEGATILQQHNESRSAPTEKLKDLDINRESGIQGQQCSALVPYGTSYQKKSILVSRRKQREVRKELVIYKPDGTLVPFDGSQTKKRRAKVDLDEETSRVWRLLLENINSQGVDGTDEEKARWWENERKVFNGRANSFIARMHLVQGDRRFSKWKGSIVDSVVGVFLTQNVSDHLSSSAFMSLAARFPLEPTCEDETYHKEGSCSARGEVEICMMHQEDSVTLDNGMLNGPPSDLCSTAIINPEYTKQKVVSSYEGASYCGVLSSTDESSCKLSAFRSELQLSVASMENQLNSINAAEMPCVTANYQSHVDDIVSSQSSATTFQSSPESSPSQTGERIRFHSDNNIGVDPAGTSITKASGGSASFLELLQMVQCPGNQEGSSRCCKEVDGLFKGEQNGAADIRPHDHPGNDTDYTNDSASSSIELGIISSDHGVTDACFDPIEVGSFRTSGKNIMPPEVPADEEGSVLNKQGCLTSMPQIAEKTINEVPNAIGGKSNMCHISSRQKDGIDMTECSMVRKSHEFMPVDQDDSDIGKRGLRSLNMKSHLTDITDGISTSRSLKETTDQALNKVLKKQTYSSDRAFYESNMESLKAKKRRVGKDINHKFDWEGLRKQTEVNGKTRGRTPETMDSLDYEAVRSAEVSDIAYTIRDRGMNNVLAGRIKDFLNRLVNEHGSIDLEWLRDVPPDKAKEYLLSIRGLGLKSVECVRLLTMHHLAFPVDTNVGRIAVRLGWVPLQPLPESLQLHLLEMYPVQESIQKYLWPRLCKLDQKTLYELHYQMITFGKVFCTKSKPNCNSCPMRGECRHFASAFASARLALPGPEERSIVPSTEMRPCNQNSGQVPERFSYQAQLLPQIMCQQEVTQGILQTSQLSEPKSRFISSEPIIEEPKSPETECVQIEDKDIEDCGYEESDEIPEIKLSIEEFTHSLQSYIYENTDLQEGDVSRALVALTPEAASIPAPKLKNVSMLRTEHHVYELPDTHPLLDGLDKRERDDPCSYLLAIWTPGETAMSVQPPEACASGEIGKLCDKETCFSCNSSREANSQTVRGTLLIPCRTAMRGSFPLNGTYFQVNEVFADHDSSLNPMNIPRKWIWNLPRRTVYFGTSIPTIFKGLSTEGIQQCFWRGYVCVRGFDQKSRAPRPLLARLHYPASKMSRTRGKPGSE
uniref:HhH-GPD domain-containing protein n=1 Tax=Kalanchoe fedtschenkoi TaxID=63787 RepID=A0A7N0U9Z3_KALFE